MNKKNRLFIKSDLIFPIGIGSLCFLLCIIAAIAANSFVPSLVCILTGLFFGATIPFFYLLRKIARNIVYITKHGVSVIWGKKHKPIQEDVELWTEEVIEHWTKAIIIYNEKTYTIPLEQIKQKVENTTAFFKDTPIRWSTYDRLLNGLSFGNDIWIALKEGTPPEVWDKVYTRSVFRHEISHNILDAITEIPFTNEGHHPIFTQIKLGA